MSAAKLITSSSVWYKCNYWLTSKSLSIQSHVFSFCGESSQNMPHGSEINLIFSYSDASLLFLLLRASVLLFWKFIYIFLFLLSSVGVCFCHKPSWATPVLLISHFQSKLSCIYINLISLNIVCGRFFSRSIFAVGCNLVQSKVVLQ